jgi:hypothetical protein
MPDETRPPVQQTVNVTGDGTGIFAGLSGWTKPAVAFGFAGLVAAAFWFLLQNMVIQQRADALEYRQLFRESIRDIQHEADRRAGEVKGALDVNTAVMRDLIAEMKAARHEGRVPQPVPGKAAELRPPAGP